MRMSTRIIALLISLICTDFNSAIGIVKTCHIPFLDQRRTLGSPTRQSNLACHLTLIQPFTMISAKIAIEPHLERCQYWHQLRQDGVFSVYCFHCWWQNSLLEEITTIEVWSAFHVGGLLFSFTFLVPVTTYMYILRIPCKWHCVRYDGVIFRI